jgi:SsrA-binding protein
MPSEFSFAAMADESREITLAVNRRAGFAYHLEERFEAGLQLLGSEIKSIRQRQVSLTEAWCVFMDGELWVKGMHIAPYRHGTHFNHQEKRDRKLLLNKSELRKLHSKVKEKGYTIIPTRIYLTPRGLAKLEIALAKGKKSFDKRQAIKKREAEKELKRIEKTYSIR